MSDNPLADVDRSPTLPAVAQRMPMQQSASPHPAMLAPETLLEQCELRTQRRSGPGGQHRNKTSSGAFLLHQPSGVVAEATERRSQAENREVALSRLRLKLATELRTLSVLDGPVDAEEHSLRERYGGGDLRVSVNNPAKPAVLAALLNDLHAAGGQPSVVASRWRTTTSAIVRFVKTHPPAFTMVNAIRGHHGRGPLK